MKTKHLLSESGRRGGVGKDKAFVIRKWVEGGGVSEEEAFVIRQWAEGVG